MTARDVIANALMRVAIDEQTKLSWGKNHGLGHLNRIYRDFVVNTRMLYGTVGATSTASTRIYAMPTAMFQYVDVRHGGGLLAKTTMEELNTDSQWWSRKGTPSSWYVSEGLNQIGLYPIPTGGEGATIVAMGYKVPAALGMSSQLNLPPEYEWAPVDALVIYYLEQHPKEPDWDKKYSLAERRHKQYVLRAQRENRPSIPRAIVHPDWGR